MLIFLILSHSPVNKLLGGVSLSLAIVLVGDFGFQDACWKESTEEKKQPW